MTGDEIKKYLKSDYELVSYVLLKDELIEIRVLNLITGQIETLLPKEESIDRYF